MSRKNRVGIEVLDPGKGLNFEGKRAQCDGVAQRPARPQAKVQILQPAPVMTPAGTEIKDATIARFYVRSNNPDRAVRCVVWRCKNVGLYMRHTGMACVDCLPAVLVAEERVR